MTVLSLTAVAETVTVLIIRPESAASLAITYDAVYCVDSPGKSEPSGGP